MIQIILIFIEINSKIQISYFQVFSINRYNPYFIGINSAIKRLLNLANTKEGRNPYFIGINSAINEFHTILKQLKKSQSLFYWN